MDQDNEPGSIAVALPTILANHEAGWYQAIDSMPCSYSSLENTSRNLVKINQTRVESLFNALVAHRNITQLGTLLHDLSTHIPDKVGLYSVDQLAFKAGIGASPAEEITIEMRLAAMLPVARRGQEFLAGNQNAEAIVKLKLMLSYLMLYLTLEHAIVPSMRAREGQLVAGRTIEGQKVMEFQTQLAQHGRPLKLSTLTEHLRYGKVIWHIVSMLGVLGLPMLAIGGPAVTSLCKNNGYNSNHFEVLGSRLAANAMWMCLCKAWAPIAIEVLFTNSARCYSSNELIRLLLVQPLPTTSIFRLSTHYLLGSKRTPPVREIPLRTPQITLSYHAAINILNNIGLKLALFPTNNYVNRATRKIELASWLLHQEAEEEVVMAEDQAKSASKRLRCITLKEFATLLPPEQISHDLVAFLGAIWNTKALPGWSMVSPLDVQGLLLGELGGDPIMAITTLLGGRRYELEYENIIVPVMVNGIILPLHVSLKERCATLYQTHDTRAATQASIAKMGVSINLVSFCFVILVNCLLV